MKTLSKAFKFLDIEKTLEAKGEINTLQRYRYRKLRGYHENPPYDLSKRLPRFLKIERKLREIAQREIKLEKDLEKNQDSASASISINIEIENLKNDYFVVEREWHWLRNRFNSGSLQRAFTLWRSNPQWYLHQKLIEDCAERGGCCGRACGCCRKRELPSNRKTAVGHCTVECDCCQETRGFELSTNAKNMLNLFYALDPDTNYRYCKRIMRVSIFGLVKGSTANPFDLIDRPPKYEENGE